MVSKIIYKQQFIAAVQKKRNIRQRQIVTTVKAIIQETVMATVNIYIKIQKELSVSVTQVVIQMANFICPPASKVQ